MVVYRWCLCIVLMGLWGFGVLGCGPSEPCSSVTCPTGQTCQNGVCTSSCAEGQTLCGTTCHNTKTDTTHCGGCNLNCREKEQCKEGVCTLSCASGQTDCSGTCIDTQTNVLHCGACGTACKSGQVCKAGACEVFCSGGTTLCSGSCVDTNANPKHCGACGTACKAEETCSSGSCVSACGAGQTDCSGTCADLQTNSDHCGQCGNVCKAREVCNSGTCELQCPQGQSLCASQCYNLQSNSLNCGACDNACEKGKACSNGQCVLSCQSNQTNCSGSCADLQTNSAHCGSCGSACKAGEACIQGTCGLLCKPNELSCSGSCVDPTSNTQHCGACGNACASGSGCCGSSCLDLQGDTKNCGACGNVCTGIKVCSNGSCACPTGRTDCGGTCLDLLTNSQHCGACNNPCKSNEVCNNGACKVAWASLGSSFSFGSSESVYAIKFDSQGNSYIVGGFRKRIEIGTLTGTHSSTTASFVAKFNSQNQVLWLKVLPIPDTSGFQGFDVDAKGNVYLAGTFRDATLNFGSFSVTNSPTTPNGTTYKNQVYVAKMDTSGNWLWATSGGSAANTEVVYDVVGDSVGNAYVTGTVLQDATTTVFGTTTLTVKGGSDVFVAKLNAQGVWQWANLGGGKSFENASSIALDSQDNIYITGKFTQEASFGLTTITSQGSDDIFVARLSPQGAWVWVNRGGGKNQELVENMVVRNNNVYIVGRYQSESIFGSLAVSAQGQFDVFVAQLNSNGLFQWVATAGGSRSDVVKSVDVDGSGNVYVVGNFSTETASTSFATFGTSKLKSTGSPTYADIFVAKLNSQGSWQWARAYGGTSEDLAWDVAVDKSGDVHVVGGFNETVGFGSTTLTSKGFFDIFVAKLSSTGAMQSVVSYEGQTAGQDYSYDLAQDSSGNTYVVGHFRGKLILGSLTLTNPGNVNNMDVFVAKVNPQGQWLWAKRGGTLDLEDYGYGIDVDSSGNVYIAGYVAGTRAGSFGSFTFNNKTNSIFIAKLNTNGAWQWLRTDTPPTNFNQAQKVKVDSKGNVYVTGTAGKGMFGSRPFNTQGGFAQYVAKLNTNGAWQWTATNGGKPSSYGYDLSLDSNGNVYVVGSAPAETYGSQTFFSNGGNDAFIGKLSSGGGWQWVRNFGGKGLDAAEAISTDSQGNVFVAGYFDGAASIGTNSFTSKGGRGIFLGKLSTSGQWQWFSSADGSKEVRAKVLSLDSQGNLYIGGYSAGSASFGSFSYSAATGSNRSLFVARADSKGQWTWLRSSPTEDSYGSEVTGLHIDGTNALFVTGHFSGTQTLTQQKLSSTGNLDVFVGMLLP